MAHPKTPVVVQTKDDPHEWLAGVVDSIEETGCYTVTVSKKKEKGDEPSRVEIAVAPPGLPKSLLQRSTTRFTDKAFAAVVNLPELTAISGTPHGAVACKLVFERVRSRREALVDVLLKMVGTFDTVEEYVEPLTMLVVVVVLVYEQGDTVCTSGAAK